VAKVETETEVSHDIYTTVPQALRRFLYLPDIVNASSITFSEKFDSEEEFLKHLRGTNRQFEEQKLELLAQRFASLQELSNRLSTLNVGEMPKKLPSFDEDDEDEDEDEIEEVVLPKKNNKGPKKKS
jgi:hypothetical protein